MKGLILKDLYLVLKTISWVYLFPIAIIIICSGSNITFLMPMIAMIIPLFFGFFISNTLHEDEKSNWDRYSGALPLSNNTRAASKYIIGGFLLICGGFLSLIVFSVLSFVFSISIEYTLILVLLGVVMSVAYISILIPAVYKYGVSKGPVIFIGLISLMVIIPIGLSSFGIKVDLNELLSNPQLIIVLSVVICIVIPAVSFLFTKSILNRKIG